MSNEWIAPEGMPPTTSINNDFEEMKNRMLKALAIPPEFLMDARASGVANVKGTGASTPKKELVIHVDDPTGDDVARDLTNAELRAFRSQKR